MEFENVVILEPEPDDKADPLENAAEEAHVGFVAITRASRQLSRIPPGQIYRAPGYKEFARGSRQRLSNQLNGWFHLSIGISGDIDPFSFVDLDVHGAIDEVKATQELLLEQARRLSGHKVMLVKISIGNNKYAYNIHIQDGTAPGRLIGRTAAQLTYDLNIVLGGKYSLPSKIFNLRIGDIVTVVGLGEPPSTLPEECLISRLWLGVTLFGTGDFKPFKKKA